MNTPVQLELAALAARRQSVRLRVNGAERVVSVDPAKRLAHVLREELGLTGTKIGCDAGDCGACTVLLDGRQVCACLVAVGQAEHREVTTVEGLGALDRPSALQQAFLACGAAQCGICTPGMLMAASELLNRNSHPTEPEICDALGGVLCRCTGYRNIVQAVRSLAARGREGETPTAGQAVGSRVAKLDGPAKVSGREKYAADFAPEGALALRVLRSPHARATFTLGDLEEFKQRWPGLVDVLTWRDVPENSFGIFPDVKDQPVLACGEVRFRGEAVLALVGDAESVAAISDEDLPIQWLPLPPIASAPEALGSAETVHRTVTDNVLCRGRAVKGDVDTAMTRAAHRVQGEFETQHVEHAYIEPEAGYAEVFVVDALQRIRVFACTQTPYMDRDEIARVLKLDPKQVHIVPSAIGGGFGGKLDIAVQPLLAVAAWKLKRPVRCVYTRGESMASTTKRHPARLRVSAACEADGRLLAVDFEGDFDTGAYASWGNTVASRVPIHASGPYNVPNVRALTRAVYTNGPICGAFRGFGVPQATIAGEALMDELADKSGLDRLEFRHLNALRAGQATATGQILRASCGLIQCLDRLRGPWDEAVRRVRAFNAHAARVGAGIGKRRGAGIACMWYGIGNTVIANPSTMRVALRNSGRLCLYNGAVDIGQGSSTVLPQICADALGLPLDLFDQVVGDTDLTADAGKTSASRQAFVSGNAAKFAGEALRAKLLQLIGSDERARLRLQGRVLVAEDASGRREVDLMGLPANDRGEVAAGEGYFNPPTVPLDQDGQGEPYATYAFGAQMAEVEVDLELGTVEVLEMHAAHDVGKAINPTQVEGQIHGGIAQGIGMALMEEYVSGKTDNLHDYLIPTIGDVPPIHVYLVEDPEPLGPFGAKGVGEPALIATAPAILSAIRDATGVRVDRLPVTPARLRLAIRAQR